MSPAKKVIAVGDDSPASLPGIARR